MSDIAFVWRKPEDEPEHNQFCHLRGCGDLIALNYCYKRDGTKGWLNLFTTADCGTFYDPKDVVAWCPCEAIPEPPDDWFEQVEKIPSCAEPPAISTQKPWWKRAWGDTL